MGDDESRHERRDAMTTFEILKAARELLSDEKRWTKGRYARDAQGNPTPTHAVDAVCWCPEGALVKFSAAEKDASINSIIVDEALLGAFRAVAATSAEYDEIPGVIFQSQLWPWNDAPERTHAEVLQRFDDAIIRLSRQDDVVVLS